MEGKVAVLGVGLIGGSLALCCKERTELEVIGYDTSSDTLALAEAMGAIDRGYTTLEKAVEQADYILIALPVGQIIETIDRLSQISLTKGCLITDVGSTKREIVEAGKRLEDKGHVFIGGHPMAGSHRSGVQAAHSRLFENAYYLLTPTPDTPLSQVQRLSQLLYEATRAQLAIIDPTYHDRIVGAISHLPHIIAAGLVTQVGKYNQSNEWFHRLAAGGFRDLTRIGASHPIMWRDILLSNREELIHLLSDWISQMEACRDAVVRQDADWIEALFAESKQLREQLPDNKKGLLTPIYECFVDVPDRPGIIGEVASLLGGKGINLSNIGVMENREDVEGVLQLSFRQQEDYVQAISCLRRMGYTVFAENDVGSETS